MFKSILLYLFLFIPLAFTYGQNLTLKTTGLDIYSFPMGELSPFEMSVLNEAVSNEYRLLHSYLGIVNRDGLSEPFNSIIEAKKYHIELIKNLSGRYEHDLILPDMVQISNSLIEKPLRQLCKLKVKEELTQKCFYEKHLMQVNNKDVEAVFSLIAENSEKTFKLLQSFIANRKS